MPTRGRRKLAAKAVDYFWSQTYQNKQLLILDDEEDPSFTLRPHCHFYARRSDPMTIGAKRNTLCAIAAGPIIAHWDSDDYSAPDRLTVQYYLLRESGKAVLGFHTLLFVNEETRQAAYYIGDPGDIVGTSLMYRREWWQEHPFDDLMIQEDMRFARCAAGLDQLYSCDVIEAGITYLMIARTHSDNTSPRVMIGENWQARDFDRISIS